MRNYWKNKRILVTGGYGFLGTHLVESLKEFGANVQTPKSSEFDLRIYTNCEKVVKDQEIVVHLAAKVGGIGYNLKHPGEMFYDNIMMGVQLIEASRIAKVKKFVSIGTICAYPKFTPVPFKEDHLWNGYPEETNAAYGLAKKMLLVQGQAYRQQYDFNAIYLLPVNMYGPGDNFNPEVSHVIPAIIMKTLQAKERGEKEIIVWGTGRATREFLYVQDAVRAVLLAAQMYDKPEPVNIGAGFEISIRELAELIVDIIGYSGKIIWDSKKPDGQPRRCLDTSKAKKEFGFVASTGFKIGLKKTIDWYIAQYKKNV